VHSTEYTEEDRTAKTVREVEREDIGDVGSLDLNINFHAHKLAKAFNLTFSKAATIQQLT
jgi:hypothetical protein